MENQIRHDGIIETIESGHVQVRIVQTAACAGCKVASRCTTAEAREKLIDVDVADSARWQVGQLVVVATQGAMAGRALMLGFGGPLVVMLAVLVGAVACGASEGAAALLMLGSLIPYYTAIWLFRERIARKISFHIVE